jgi:hypothetical protein
MMTEPARRPAESAPMQHATRVFVAACLLGCGAAGERSASGESIAFHVAIDGDDSHSGSVDAPVVSLERARDAVRDLARRQGLPPGGVRVVIHGGVHARNGTFELSHDDSGTPEAPIVYVAASDEIPILAGMVAVRHDWFESVSDRAILDRVIDPAARERLLQCNLQAHGIVDYGELSRRGHDVTRPEITKTPPPELYVDGRRMPRARWPNPDDHFPQFLRGVQQARHGVVGRAEIVDPGPTADDPDFLARGGTIRFAFDRPALWALADDIWLSGVFSWSWQWSYNRVASIDVPSKTITLRYGERSGITDRYSHDYFFAENLLEEIDRPGEYVLDRASGTLFLLPPEGFDEGGTDICLSMLAAPLIRLSNASHIRFEGLTLDGGRSSGVVCRGGESVVVERCEVRNVSATGIDLQGRNHGVRGCHIHHVGGVGVGLSGGDSAALAPGGLFVEDSDIHHFAWLDQVYAPAVLLGDRSVGSRVAHNRIRHGPHVAVTVYGNDHLIEYNDIGHVVEDFTDMGAIYANLGSRPLERGTVIRRNYVHDIGRHHHLQNGVYPDNGTMGWLIEENVFHRIGGRGDAANCRAVNNNTGAHVVTRHNVFIDCTIPYLMGTFCAPFHDTNVARWEDYFRSHDLAQLPHAEKYPELLRFWQEPRQYPDTNRFEGNVIFNPTVPLLQSYGKLAMRDGAIVEKGGILKTTDNWITADDPGFTDAAVGDFTLPGAAEAARHIPGFPGIDFDMIGPRHRAAAAH